MHYNLCFFSNLATRSGILSFPLSFKNKEYTSVIVNIACHMSISIFKKKKRKKKKKEYNIEYNACYQIWKQNGRH